MMTDRWLVIFSLCAICVSGLAAARWLERVQEYSAQHQQLIRQLEDVRRQLQDRIQEQAADLQHASDLPPQTQYDFARWQDAVQPADHRQVNQRTASGFVWKPQQTTVHTFGGNWTLHTVPWQYQGSAPHGLAVLEPLDRFQTALDGLQVSRCSVVRGEGRIDLDCEGVKHGLELVK